MRCGVSRWLDFVVSSCFQLAHRDEESSTAILSCESARKGMMKSKHLVSQMLEMGR
jgi:hypothetical protein